MVDSATNPLITALRFNFSGGMMYHKMFNVFDDQFKSGVLKAYLPEEDREIVLKDDSTVREVRTLKGVTLNRIVHPSYTQANEGRALLLVRSNSDTFLNNNNLGLYILKVGSAEIQKARQGFEGRIDNFLHLQKLENSLDLYAAIPNEMFQQGTNKIGLSIKDQYISSSLDITYIYATSSCGYTNVVATVRPPEVVDGFMMNIIDHIRESKVAGDVLRV